MLGKTVQAATINQLVFRIYINSAQIFAHYSIIHNNLITAISELTSAMCHVNAPTYNLTHDMDCARMHGETDQATTINQIVFRIF